MDGQLVRRDRQGQGRHIHVGKQAHTKICSGKTHIKSRLKLRKARRSSSVLVHAAPLGLALAYAVHEQPRRHLGVQSARMARKSTTAAVVTGTLQLAVAAVERRGADAPDAVDPRRRSPRLRRPRREPAEARAHPVGLAWVHAAGDAVRLWSSSGRWWRWLVLLLAASLLSSA